jgi:hypothetical protein
VLLEDPELAWTLIQRMMFESTAITTLRQKGWMCKTTTITIIYGFIWSRNLLTSALVLAASIQAWQLHNHMEHLRYVSHLYVSNEHFKIQIILWIVCQRGHFTCTLVLATQIQPWQLQEQLRYLYFLSLYF